jgi:hypothetical protein
LYRSGLFLGPKMKKLLVIIILFTLVLLVLGLWSSGCQEDLGTSPISTYKGNLKLETTLNQLAQIEIPAELTSFVQQNNIDLKEGKIRVVIECLPGKIGAVANAASSLITIESRYENLLQALVSPANLDMLTQDANIKYIRLPQAIQPAMS